MTPRDREKLEMLGDAVEAAIEEIYLQAFNAKTHLMQLRAQITQELEGDGDTNGRT